MIYINFSAEINEHTVEALMNFLANQINGGEREFYILFSSPGGNVREGVNLYNYLKSLPIKLIMHNIGIVDSIANVIFLAGSERYAVPNSSFLFHGVGINISQPTRLTEKELQENIEIIERDQELMIKILAERTKLSHDEIKILFLKAQAKSPEEAKKMGLIQEIKEVKIPEGAKVFSFAFPQRPWR